MKVAKILSKTNLKKGLQCPKALYLALHRTDLKGETSPETQAVKDVTSIRHGYLREGKRLKIATNVTQIEAIVYSGRTYPNRH